MTSTVFFTKRENILSGEWGSPTGKKGINIISIAIDAPQDVISSLSGKIGRLSGVSAKNGIFNVITKSGGQEMIKLRYTERAASENPPQFPMWR